MVVRSARLRGAGRDQERIDRGFGVGVPTLGQPMTNDACQVNLGTMFSDVTLAFEFCHMGICPLVIPILHYAAH